MSSSTEKLNGNTRNITYTYDGDSRVTTYKKGNVSQNYTYDGFGRNSQKVVKNGSSTLLTTSHTFRTVSGNPTGQIATLKNQAANYNVTYTYTYDSNGNILSVNDGTYTTTYEYDESNQLVRENNPSIGTAYIWTYDNSGNIRTREIYTYVDGELEMLLDNIEYTHGNGEWGDLLTQGYRPFTYDQIGNTLSDGTRTYTWQHGRQLATLTQNGKTWTNSYNADGLRTKRTDGTNTYQYTYSEGKLISMTYNSDTLYFSYTPDGLPYNVEYNGTQYVYALNLQGDVMAILNTAGQAVVEYTYDAWGNYHVPTGSMKDTLGQINPLRYRGYVYDRETQLYYLQSRYYDPEIGRFICADKFMSTGQGILGHNMYAYCGNNPVNLKDLDGESPETAVLTWTSTMWWLTAADGPFPVGDVVFAVGVLLFTIETVDSIDLNENAGVTYYSPHSKNKSNSNRNKHEEGDSRRKRDQGGEKKKQKDNWKPKNNKRNHNNQPYGKTGVWRIDRLM